MQYPSSKQPLAVKLANRAGGFFINRLGLKTPTLDPHSLLAAASRRTGLDDFGDRDFMPALDRLARALDEEARLSLVGRFGARAMLVENLERRLLLTDYRKQRPGIADEPIVRPLFVLGLPRTGTTIFYELLAQDPNHRAPMSWEVEKPVPPAREETFTSDPRIDEVEKKLAGLEALAPGFKAIHETGARLPQECVGIQASHFISDQYGITFAVPGYRRWTLDQDMTGCYRWHARFLQHLQADYRKPRWVLKTPGHLPYIHALLAQYPDAAIVQTHRDPMDVMGSISSLACTLHSAFSDHIDPRQTAQAELDHCSEALNRAMRQRAALPDENSRFYDVRFADIIDDPVRVIEQVYRHFGFDFTQEFERRMRRYLDSRPRDKHGTHRYALEQFGLSRQTHGPLFRDYCERFGL